MYHHNRRGVPKDEAGDVKVTEALVVQEFSLVVVAHSFVCCLNINLQDTSQGLELHVSNFICPGGCAGSKSLVPASCGR